jgi:hypothetical protein
MRICLKLVPILLAGAVLPVRAEIVFSGYLTLDGDTKVILADGETGRKSELLGVGGTFAGHTVAGFDAKRETVAVVTQGAEARVLSLKQAEVRPFTEVDRAAAAQRATRLAELKRESEAHRAASKTAARGRGSELRAQAKADAAVQRQNARMDAEKYPGRADMQQAVASYRASLTEQLRRAKFNLEQVGSGQTQSQQARRAQAQAQIADAARKLAELEREK